MGQSTWDQSKNYNGAHGTFNQCTYRTLCHASRILFHTLFNFPCPYCTQQWPHVSTTMPNTVFEFERNTRESDLQRSKISPSFVRRCSDSRVYSVRVYHVKCAP